MQNLFLRNYIEIIEGDLKKMVGIAKRAEKKYKIANSGPTPISVDYARIISTPGLTTTAMPPPPSVNNRQPIPLPNPKYARCAVPIAMILTSAVEFIGTLLHTSNVWSRDFNLSLIKFFEYAEAKGCIDETLSHQERDLFRDIYRNGYMHAFFPQGLDVAINFDSSFKGEKLLFQFRGKMELNVYRFHQIVVAVFKNILLDTEKQDNIAARYLLYKQYAIDRTKDTITAYKNSL